MTAICRNLDKFYFVVYDLYDTALYYFDNYIEFENSFKIPKKELVRKIKESKDNYFLVMEGLTLRRVHYFAS